MATFTGINNQDEQFNIEAENSDVALTNEQLAEQSGVIVNQSESSALTSNDLESVEDIKLIQPTSNTEVSGELAGFESQTDQFTRDLQTETDQARKAEESSFQSLVDFTASAPGAREITAREEDRVGLSDIKSELKGINDQLRQEQHALRRKIESIQDNEEGLFGGAVSQEIDRVQRNSYRKQADLAVIQMSIQGRYDSAKEIADRAIAVESERQQRKLDILGMNYQRNKDLFSKAEQRSFEVKLADRQRKIQEEAEDRKMLSDAKLSMIQSATSQGAPASVLAAIQSSKTAADAIKAAGLYSGDILDRQLKQAQIAAAWKALEPAPTGSDVASLLMEMGVKDEGGLYSEILASKGGDKLVASETEKIDKFGQALDGIVNLNSLLIQGKDGIDLGATGPISGKKRQLLTKLGGDAQAAEINATIQGLIPTVARGIFGEVGVLTNEDIENYRKVVPNITNTADQNRLISIMMMDVLGRGSATFLTNRAKNNQDVSRYASSLARTQNIITSEKAKLGITQYSNQSDTEFGDSIPTPAAAKNDTTSFYSSFNFKL